MFLCDKIRFDEIEIESRPNGRVDESTNPIFNFIFSSEVFFPISPLPIPGNVNACLPAHLLFKANSSQVGFFLRWNVRVGKSSLRWSSTALTRWRRLLFQGSRVNERLISRSYSRTLDFISFEMTADCAFSQQAKVAKRVYLLNKKWQ